MDSNEKEIELKKSIDDFNKTLKDISKKEIEPKKSNDDIFSNSNMVFIVTTLLTFYLMILLKKINYIASQFDS